MSSGSEWRARAVDVASTLRDRWQLELFPAFTHDSASWVAPARRASGAEVVLKIGWPHYEAEHEAEGLAFWDGDGVVRLLESATIGGVSALLLERCLPGTPLSAAVPPEDQDVVVAGLLRRLWRLPPDDYPFRSLAQMCGAWADGAAARLAGTSGLDVVMVRAGIELFRDLPASAASEVMLFTDLHAGNVLAAEREAYLAVDPKPYVGDPAYDVVQHLLARPGLTQDPLGSAARMAALANLDSARVRLWLFSRCCVEAVTDPRLQSVARLLAP